MVVLELSLPSTPIVNFPLNFLRNTSEQQHWLIFLLVESDVFVAIVCLAFTCQLDTSFDFNNYF